MLFLRPLPLAAIGPRPNVPSPQRSNVERSIGWEIACA